MEVEEYTSMSTMGQPSSKPFQRESSVQTIKLKQMHFKQQPSCSSGKKEAEFSGTDFAEFQLVTEDFVKTIV